LWFEWNTTKLRQDREVDSVVQLAAVIKTAFDHLRAKPNGRLVLTGFASTEGEATHNKNLSLQRAQRVKSLLVDAGVPEDRIQVIGGGTSIAWPGGLKWNRRVQIDFQP
jgi:outer membrane protein OmpA-like peptidoglycan-associated protein